MKAIFGKAGGQVMVLYVGVLAVLLGAIGLCTDVGIMYMNWQQLQKAADAAVLAGANYLPSDPSTAISTASAWPLNNSVLASEIASGPTVDPTNTQISITLKRTVPYNFAQVLGMVSNDVVVTATAQVQNLGGAGGNHLIPVGFACPTPPCTSVGENILLPGEVAGPPGKSAVSPGNWGLLQFDDGQSYNGSHFKSSLVNGYQGTAPILLGTNSGVSGAQSNTGNDVNKQTQPGLTDRYNAGSLTLPLPSPMTAADFADPRIIEIPMISGWPPGTATVDVTGFITAVLVPDGSGGFYAQVVSISLSEQVGGGGGGPSTGTTAPVLIQ
jgi:Putative Flp pilus-assembly TadE/G-like